mgnify:FL=1
MIPYFYMDNFFFGLQAVMVGTIDLVRRIFAYKVFWGFAFGFFVSTVFHAFLLSDNPRHIATMLLKDHASGFQKLYQPDTKNVYHHSFRDYMKQVDKMKFTFSLSGMFLLLLLFLIVLLSL